jgi:hypothetical protein
MGTYHLLQSHECMKYSLVLVWVGYVGMLDVVPSRQMLGFIKLKVNHCKMINLFRYTVFIYRIMLNNAPDTLVKYTKNINKT